jgi:hypothetical protein
MDCSSIEQRLSDYLASDLPAEEKSAIRTHLNNCENCTVLLNEMHSLISACHDYPVLEMDVDLLEKILLRTSGRPRTLSLREQIQLLLWSMLTPRFAAGAGLAILFLTLSLNFMLPRAASAFASTSPLELLSWMDRGTQFIYGEGLKAFDKKNAWLAEFRFFKNNTTQKIRFMMEKFNIPIEEGRKKPAEPMQEKKQVPSEKYSRLLSWQACLIKKPLAGQSAMRGKDHEMLISSRS